MNATDLWNRDVCTVIDEDDRKRLVDLEACLPAFIYRFSPLVVEYDMVSSVVYDPWLRDVIYCLGLADATDR